MRVDHKEKAVYAEKTGGGEVCLGKANYGLGMAWMDGLTNVKGAPDGSESVATMVTSCLETSMTVKTEKIRLKDEAVDVRRAFIQAGLRAPRIDEPSKVAKAIALFDGKSGPDLYTYASGAVKKIYGALIAK